MSKYILEPKVVNGITWYYAIFPSLVALYNYLKSNPKINKDVFITRASLNKDYTFHGEPLDKSIEYLLGGYNRDLDQFLKLQRQLDSKITSLPKVSKFENTVVGSRIHIPNALAGSPNFMIKPSNYDEQKFVNIYFSFSYSERTMEEEIRNRGLITLNLIRLLENNNYKVNLSTFSLSYIGDEYMYIVIQLKKYNSNLSVSDCYFPFVSKEFSRRILFYCKETMPVEDKNWGFNYGRVFTLDQMRNILNLKENDILIGSPTYMGVNEDLEESVNNMFEKININKYVKIKEM